MKKIGCWKGIRHRLGLKVRGQRTVTTGRLGITIGTDFHGSKNRDKCLSNYEHLIRKLKGMIGRARRYNNEGRKTPSRYNNETVRVAHNIIKKNKR